MVRGIGCDIIEVERIRQALSRQPDRFLEYILTPDERILASRLKDPTQFLTGRFVAKEALSKALGCGIGSTFSWQSAAILNDTHGKPYVKWFIDVENLFGITETLLSISHSKTVAMAYVIVQ